MASTVKAFHQVKFAHPIEQMVTYSNFFSKTLRLREAAGLVGAVMNEGNNGMVQVSAKLDFVAPARGVSTRRDAVTCPSYSLSYVLQSRKAQRYEG